MHPLVGLVLTPDAEWLGRMRPLLPKVGLFVLTPETLWKPAAGKPAGKPALDGRLRPNSYHREFLALKEFSGKPFAAHSVAMSPGSPDSPRRRRWLQRMAEEQALFDFQWWTDHAGYTEREGRNLALPLPLPPEQTWASMQADCLSQMAEIVPEVGLETSWFSSLPGSWQEEVELFEASTRGRRILLDLHNVWAMALNLGFEPLDFILSLDLERVIEIHVSGGRDAPNGVRLDSHDTAIPEPVFELLEQVAPRCPGLRAVTLERFEGTVKPNDVSILGLELDRIGALCEGCTTQDIELPAPPPRVGLELQPPAPPEQDRLAQALIAKLRFERLVNGSDAAAAAFEEDAARFAEDFRRYAAEVPATAWFPNEEGRLWERWRAQAGGGGVSS